MKGREGKGTLSADLLVCFPSRSHLTLMPKSICSPARPSEPNKRHHRHHHLKKTSNSGGVGQASPLLWAKTKTMGVEISEPTSPEVTCAGQIKVRPKASSCKNWQSVMEEIERLHNNRKNKKRPNWVEALGLKKDIMQFLTCLRSIRFDFHCFGSFPTPDITSDDEEDDFHKGMERSDGSETSRTFFSKWFMVLQENQNNGFTKEESRARERSCVDAPCAPPSNALLLMRCRSAPAKSLLEEREDEDEEEEEDKDEDEERVKEEEMKAKFMVEEEKRKKKENMVVMRYDTDIYKFSSDIAKETWVVGAVIRRWPFHDVHLRHCFHLLCRFAGLRSGWVRGISSGRVQLLRCQIWMGQRYQLCTGSALEVPDLDGSEVARSHGDFDGVVGPHTDTVRYRPVLPPLLGQFLLDVLLGIKSQDGSRDLAIYHVDIVEKANMEIYRIAMDSANSGSMQSSSTNGDEEYDSRTESISPFLNPSGHFSSISSNPQPPHLSHHQSHPSTLFDSPSHNLGAFSQSVPANPNSNSLYNLDLVWSRGLRSDPNYTDLGNLTGLSSSSSSLLATQVPNQGQFPSSSSMPLRSVDGNGGRATLQTDQTNVVKNSKKRTRASRRAPTTVLTTDTSNFRQMVQEFTGIPAPPFSASPYSRRLDLFGSGSALRTGLLEPLGPLYPLRPSVQKAQQSPFVSSSSSPSLLSAIAPTTNIASSTNNTITTSTAGTNYQLSSDLGLLPKQTQNMLNMQNPILPFQSLLQSPSPSFKYPSANASGFGSKSQGSSAIPSLDELGMSHEHVSANLRVFPSHGSTDGTQARRDNINLTRWRDEAASNNGGREQLGSFDGNNGNSQHVGNYKLNCSASTSDLHPEKGLENVSSRGEGTVDSWICPSD
ncbi:hypothetical protein F0562_027364 [Nyssa sinensis]|uniref:VQ domain-containing protein n=1 Tax=Nyssa sinensis TaxID=561372 RepID=A0A5J5B6Y1_9ASTE|nr:hypothetical protein F0562_027364 [Nyssa sinensis]